MNEQVQKIYEYVSKMEEMHLNKLTGGRNIEADAVNSSAMSAYGMTRWFIEFLNGGNKEDEI